MSADLLQTVVAAARKSAQERERACGKATVDAASQATPQGDRFAGALTAPGVPIIAECKRRSPSRGVLRASYDPVAIASAYQAHGAAALSVLTEPTFFDGSLDHLRAVRAAVALPILRKDFVVEEFQILEAAAAGADAVLLIVAALDVAALRPLMARAQAIGLATLVEVHNRAELDAALEAGATIIGVNSRNLRTLAVDPAVFAELAPHIPDNVTAVAESGLRAGEDLARNKRLGYDAFLVGERFMADPDPGSALGRLRLDAEAALAS
jgi:indole-3-glycerol phosphate synthase